MKSYDTIILGAGPAGLTAGIYLSRAKQKVLILDTGTGEVRLFLPMLLRTIRGCLKHLGIRWLLK